MMESERKAESFLHVGNDTKHLQAIREFVHDGIIAGGFPVKLSNRIIVAVDEAVTNVVEHAFKGVPYGDGEIKIKQVITPEQYSITIEDNGLSFTDANKACDIDMQQHVRAGRDGGLGIFFMREVMDVVDYQYEQNVCNRLLLVKYARS